jgi:hypothetical protein
MQQIRLKTLDAIKTEHHVKAEQGVMDAGALVVETTEASALKEVSGAIVQREAKTGIKYAVTELSAAKEELVHQISRAKQVKADSVANADNEQVNKVQPTVILEITVDEIKENHVNNVNLVCKTLKPTQVMFQFKTETTHHKWIELPRQLLRARERSVQGAVIPDVTTAVPMDNLQTHQT